MKSSIRKGVGFGLTSGIITTLGLMVGLSSGTGSKSIVIGAILLIAIADSLSDSLGIHVSEEFELKHKKKEVWESMTSTFFTKFIITLTFIIPVLILNLNLAIIISIVWGLVLLTIFSYIIAKQKNAPPHKAILEHLVIAVIVIIITHYLGIWVSSF